MKRYLTSRPKLEASIHLLRICRTLKRTTEDRFTDVLTIWHLKHKSLLEEKTLNPTTGRLIPTHAKLVATYRSLITNLPYLFTYKRYKHLGLPFGYKIPNTINHVDGGVFSQLKNLIKLHQGLAKRRKVKFIDEFLSNYNKKK